MTYLSLAHRVPKVSALEPKAVTQFYTLISRVPMIRTTHRYFIADICREVNPVQRLFAYASIPAISLPLGSHSGHGGYYESVRASYTREEAKALLDQSDLPPGKVWLESTWFVPILVMASERAA